MTPESLFYETLTEALRAIIATAGGTKAVAAQLWPEKTPDGAHRYLLDCLNDSRQEKLSPEHVLWLLALGRKVGCHAAINFMAREAGYADPAPLNPEDERARLQREFVEGMKGMTLLVDRMERLMAAS